MEGCTLLYVEDEDSAAFLSGLHLTQAELPASVYRVSDGEQALEFLRKSGAYQRASTPKLTVLDLSLPRRDGWWVLNEIKRDEHLRSIPVIIISTAPVHLNKVRAASSGAHAYLEKPYDLEDLAKQLKYSYGPFLCV